jgi:hypothetical protein
MIKRLHQLNPDIQYEVGTEEAIRPFNLGQLDTLLLLLKRELNERVYQQIAYVVVQSGVGLNLPEQRNTGKYNENKLKTMIRTCNEYNVKSKEHNGDYLSADDIHRRYEVGLDAINIAPEFGQIETAVYIDNLKPTDLETFHAICKSSTSWHKWARRDLDSNELMLCAGHYVLSNPHVVKITGKYPELKNQIKDAMRIRIEEILHGQA